MFYELIYTRCRQGIDITRKGQQISSEGYKVYSCTPAIMKEGIVDLQLLASAAQTKQSYTDPGFMDDAYLFYVPDTGSGFLVNFYPVPFDANAKGGYSHRPGNFVNHVLIGDFSQFYPYELFQDNNIWNAKKKGEAYYYENDPAELPVRSNISDPPGHYGFDEIGAFIADGRKEALAKAVSFLITQYKEEPEKRKYLVIRDDSSRNIELWIAAIECAFSPRMASAVPFATRMDKFVSTNRYTVKQGVYQAQMNLQDPNQKQRYHAMVVGVDERDKSGVNAARPLANSPFVLLDGKQKQAMFEGETSNRYYRLITLFDDTHIQFCREFLQTFNISSPSVDVYDLCDIFTVLNEPSIPGARVLADVLNKLTKYQASNTYMLKNIYKRIDNDISRFIQEDLSCALNIINWLQKTSKIIGDADAKQRLTGIVCNVFADLVFSKSDNAAKRSYWEQIQQTEFAMSVARVIAEWETIKENLPNLRTFTPADVAVFIAIYLESVSLIGNIEGQHLKAIVKFGIDVCCHHGDAKSLDQIRLSLSKIKDINAREFLLTLVKRENKETGEFIVRYLIDSDASIIASDSSLRLFCGKLNDEGFGYLIISVLKKYFNVLNGPSDIENFIKTIHDMTFIGEKVLLEIFEIIDTKIDPSANDLSSLAELLQKNRPRDAVCRNSAHLFALSIVSDNRRRQSLIDIFNDLKSQDFPTITGNKYIDMLVQNLIKARLSMEEQLFILNMLFHAPKGYFSVYVNELLPVAAKNKGKWMALFMYAAEHNAAVIDDIVRALVDSRQNEKSLAALGRLLEDENSLGQYNLAADKAWELISSQKQKSGIGRLFGLVFGSKKDEPDAGRH